MIGCHGAYFAPPSKTAIDGLLGTIQSLDSLILMGMAILNFETSQKPLRVGPPESLYTATETDLNHKISSWHLRGHDLTLYNKNKKSIMSESLNLKGLSNSSMLELISDLLPKIFISEVINGAPVVHGGSLCALNIYPPSLIRTGRVKHSFPILIST